MIRGNMRRLFLTAALLATAGCLVRNQPLARSAATQPAVGLLGHLDAVVDGTPLVGKPVLLKVTLTNIGDKPLSYWCGGPELYPAAENFLIILTSADGKSREIMPTNGQYTVGSGVGRDIKPGEAVEVPL